MRRTSDRVTFRGLFDPFPIRPVALGTEGFEFRKSKIDLIRLIRWVRPIRFSSEGESRCQTAYPEFGELEAGGKEQEARTREQGFWREHGENWNQEPPWGAYQFPPLSLSRFVLLDFPLLSLDFSDMTMAQCDWGQRPP